MKKTIALLLALVLCLGLCACGDNGGAGSDPTSAPSETDGTLYGAEGSAYADHPLLEESMGEWNFVFYGGPGEYPSYSSLILNGDGTCVLDGGAAHWKIEDEETNGDALFLGIYRDGVSIYGAEICSNGYDILVLCPWYNGAPSKGGMPENAYLTHFSASGDYVLAGNGAKVLKLEVFRECVTFVELTPENWRDYFRMTVTEKETTNAFGEVTGSYLHYAVEPADLGQCWTGWCNPVSEQSAARAVLELQSNITGESWINATTSTTIHDGSAKSEEELPAGLEDFELLRIQGLLVLVTVPEEYWSVVDGYDRIYVMGEDGELDRYLDLADGGGFKMDELLVSLLAEQQ